MKERARHPAALGLPPVLRSPGFAFLWAGVGISAIGMRATAAANLWQLQVLTDSTLAVGLGSLIDGAVVLGLAPIGGSVADRMDRRRLLQLSQGASLLAATLLAVLSFAGALSPLWIYAAMAAAAAAVTFDVPARQSLIPALVPADRVVDAFAVIVPMFNFARFAGPALAGVIIATWGAGVVYAIDALTSVVLIVGLALIKLERLTPPAPQAMWKSIVEGARYVRARSLIWQLLVLDLSATFFTAYKVLLPTLARDTFGVGPSGYGILAGAPALGGVFGAGMSYRFRSFPRKGLLVLGATMTYAIGAYVLAVAPVFAIAVASVALIGIVEALSATIRQAVILSETPDRLRGRVTSLYQMTVRGGPSLGQAQLGALAAALGPPGALIVGASLTLVSAITMLFVGRDVRDYRG